MRCYWPTNKLIFLDETAIKTDMIRRYGWSPIGQRCIDCAPGGHWQTSTLIAALLCTGFEAPWVLDGSMTGDMFKIYLQTQLVPILKPGDRVICDNLSAHKVSGVSEIVESVGSQLIYLPPYSPDLNPIEQAFSKLKSYLEKAAIRVVDQLWRYVGDVLDMFSAKECENFFNNSGYCF